MSFFACIGAYGINWTTELVSVKAPHDWVGDSGFCLMATDPNMIGFWRGSKRAQVQYIRVLKSRGADQKHH